MNDPPRSLRRHLERLRHHPGGYQRPGGDAASGFQHVVARDLIAPDEIMRLPSEAMILLSTGQKPALARKLRYYTDPEFRPLFERF